MGRKPPSCRPWLTPRLSHLARYICSIPQFPCGPAPLLPLSMCPCTPCASTPIQPLPQSVLLPFSAPVLPLYSPAPHSLCPLSSCLLNWPDRRCEEGRLCLFLSPRGCCKWLLCSVTTALSGGQKREVQSLFSRSFFSEQTNEKYVQLINYAHTQ